MPSDANAPKPPLFPNDRATVPAALESDSATAWAEFERLQAQPLAETAFAPTEVAGLPHDQRPAQRPARVVDLQEVLVEARRYNRICPKPEAWQRFHAMLAATGPARRPPPAPLSGQAWRETAALQKRMCLRDQLEWAEQQGVLPQVMAFFDALPEAQWHHVDSD